MPEKPRKSRARYDAVSSIIDNLTDLPAPIREVPFAPMRKWAFDIAWREYMVAVEYEGSTWQQGGHNSGAGFRSDVDKYNTAAILGWCVIRVTADMLRDLSYILPIVQALHTHGYEDPGVVAERASGEARLVVRDPWEHADIGGK